MMKREVANTIKWSMIDKLSSQALYAITGVVLARMLTHADFGLVGAILVFQAFASMFVESGFASALIQRKNPTDLDYSSVMWFNIIMAVFLYIVLFFAAPLIADWFQGDMRLVPLSRVMFLSFIISATAIVPTNRLFKQLNVKMVTVSNSLALVAGAVVGIWLALAQYGAWAIVWQTITVNAVKSIVLWSTTKWRPLMKCSLSALKSFFKVGMGVMISSFLNNIFLNIYSFFIGNRAGLAQLGLYTQSDKWSKMGIISLSQSITQAFLPPLSELQDDPERFAQATGKMNRCTSYITFPCLGLLIVMAAPIFHLLFDNKWDGSIALFQILLIRGVFTIMAALYNNYILSLSKSKMLVISEIVRDGIALLALIPTLGLLTLSDGADSTYGLRIFLWGQVLATAVGCFVTLYIASKYIGRSCRSMMADSLPYIPLTLIAVGAAWWVPELLGLTSPIIILCVQGVIAVTIYFGLNLLLGSKVQSDALNLLLRRK